VCLCLFIVVILPLTGIRLPQQVDHYPGLTSHGNDGDRTLTDDQCRPHTDGASAARTRAPGCASNVRTAEDGDGFQDVDS